MGKKRVNFWENMQTFPWLTHPHQVISQKSESSWKLKRENENFTEWENRKSLKEGASQDAFPFHTAMYSKSHHLCHRVKLSFHRQNGEVERSVYDSWHFSLLQESSLLSQRISSSNIKREKGFQNKQTMEEERWWWQGEIFEFERKKG